MEALMRDQLRLFLDRLMTPVDELILLADELGNLRAVDWTDHEQRMHRLLAQQYRAMHVTMEPTRNPFGLTCALDSYFEGDLECLRSLPVETGGTVFQRRTISYGTLAERLGQPAAVRAVGLANGANPLSIVVPCHRVIGADGSLTGYAGGLQRKQWLLDHEQKHGTVHDRHLSRAALSAGARESAAPVPAG
jgi:methylated-DNA-[protein]-cysteine S-methyltransferase